MLATTSQRWRDGRERRVPIGPLIDPAHYSVDALEERKARPFVVRHHYSRTFPAARFCAGLFRGADLVGVAVFSVPMNNRAVPLHTGLTDPNHGAELGRLVLLDDVPGNAESWFLSRAFAALQQSKRDIKAVLSYADPEPRLGADGSMIKPGHLGIIYQALSADYRGRSAPRTAYRTANGDHVSGRALSKIRLGERGFDYAAAQLHRLGARQVRGEDGRAWVDRLVRERFLLRFTHPGNHTYVFPLTLGARARSRRLPLLDYPKHGAGTPL